MQKFTEKLNNVPTDDPQVCSTTSGALNKEETLSVHGIVRSVNHSDVDQSNRQRSIKPLVYVLSRGNKPLMPCTMAKAKRMLKKGACQVVKRTPFTVKLNFTCKNKVQKIELGIDSGAKFIGFSAVSKTKELISGEVKLDTMMKKRLQDRAMYRRNRRSRLWYREPRFDNRCKKAGWLPPSIERRYQTHLTIINKIKKILPIKDVIIEVGNFDIQRIKNPEIQGTEYQQGDRYGYENAKAYIIAREGAKCQLCGKTVIGTRINLHHIIPRSKGGTDKANNLALLHYKCHNKLHKQNIKLKKNKQYKEATFMNIIKGRFTNDIECKPTFGYKTFCNRIKLNIPKSHSNDAFVIAGGTDQIRIQQFRVIQKRKNNRSLQKNRRGFAPSIRRQRYSIQPKDLVKIDGKWLTTSGSHCKGQRILVNKKSININKIERVYHVGTLGGWQFLPQLKQGVSLPKDE